MACVQPCFLPWKGFFHIIQKSDVFVFYDDAQYDRRSWRNRNRIKTPSGSKWLTVPVHVKGRYYEAINKVRIRNDLPWKHKHLETIRHSYTKAPFFEMYFEWIRGVYDRDWSLISDLDIALTRELSRELGLSTRFALSSELDLVAGRTEKLVEICLAHGADRYLSGPTAKAYIQEEKFIKAGLELEYMEYQYPEHPQLHGPFDHFVSIIDLLFNCGPEAPCYIWGDRP